MFDTTPDLLEALSERLCSYENYGVCLDFAHASLSKVAPAGWAKRLGKYVKHVHLNDNDLQEDLHMVPGDGKIDFADMKRLAEEYHAECPVLLEVNGADRQRRALEYMCKL